MLSIGAFSMAARLSVKTLRFYHEQGLLIPDYIDKETGYRYYKVTSVDKAIVISRFRSMNYSIDEIKNIVSNINDDIDIVDSLKAQKDKIEKNIQHYKEIRSSLDELIQKIRSNEMNDKMINHAVEEKNIEDIIFSGLRYKGKYDEIGNYFTKVGKKAGRFISGKPMALYHDGEYREADADIEAGFPVSKSIMDEEISCRVLPGERAFTLIHRGPYDTIGSSYRIILSHIEKRGFRMKLPSREIYHKGPGILFRGNPDNYLTEIQIIIET